MSSRKDIQAIQPEIENLAREYGLDFFPVVFELVDYDMMSQLAAYGGFPVRYPHWRFGMEYDQLTKGYRYGLQKNYEMVINTNPCYAYLMQSNSLVDQKLVMAHAMAHCDFFKHNYYFA
ncbi:MAG: SpoVR family protein, partial [Calditrichia bacterium]